MFPWFQPLCTELSGRSVICHWVLSRFFERKKQWVYVIQEKSSSSFTSKGCDQWECLLLLLLSKHLIKYYVEYGSLSWFLVKLCLWDTLLLKINVAHTLCQKSPSQVCWGEIPNIVELRNKNKKQFQMKTADNDLTVFIHTIWLGESRGKVRYTLSWVVQF